MTVTIELLELYQVQLQASMIDNVSDTSKAGVVKIGPTQGEPEPDVARISITIHPNDPDSLDEWQDDVVEVEMPNTAYWSRKFTIKYQLLLENTAETLLPALTLASLIKDRIEQSILSTRYVSLNNPTERVVRGPIATSSHSHMTQGGGPPDSYNIQGKYRFDVLTVTTIT